MEEFWLLIYLGPPVLSGLAGNWFLAVAGDSAWRALSGCMLLIAAVAAPVSWFAWADSCFESFEQCGGAVDALPIVVTAACALLPIVAVIGDLWRRSSW